MLVDRQRDHIGPALKHPVVLNLLGLGILLSLSSPVLAGPGDTGRRTSGSSTVSTAPADKALIDVGVMVFPQLPDSARVAIGYRQRVAHSRVQHEISRLLKTTGWRIGPGLVIEDRSTRPNDLKRFPITTAAVFTVLQAPQVHDSAPQLLPYLQAFQSWDHVEVIFAIPDLVPYNGVTIYESQPLTVQLIKEENSYRYDADIRDHTGVLPTLPVSVKTPREGSAVRGNPGSASASPSMVLPYTLMILGAGLTIGVGVYLLLSRRASRDISARSIRH
jgi:hypothetical protein